MIKKTQKKFLVLCLVGLGLRLLLMPITLHPDIWAVSFSQNLVAFKGVWNIYDYLGNLPSDSPLAKNYGQNFFTYPPLAYFTFGLFGLILKPFFNYDFFNNLAVNLPKVLTDSRLFWHLFLTKLPYLFFDIGVLILLMKLFDDKKKKFLVAILWFFNPLSFYTSFMIGQFDIIPVFFTVLSLYLVIKKEANWAAFCLGLGGAYKMFPLFFLPFLVLTENKNLWEKLKLFLLGIGPFVLTSIPFISSAFFRQNVLFSNQSQKMLFAKINVSGAEYISLFVAIYVFLISLALLKKIELWKWFLCVMLAFFSLTHFHPQWFLWISPFLAIFWVEYPKYRFFPIVLFLSWFLITIFFEPSLSVGLFAPISKSLTEVQSLSETVNRFYDVFILKSLLRSIFAGISLAISALLISKK